MSTIARANILTYQISGATAYPINSNLSGYYINIGGTITADTSTQSFISWNITEDVFVQVNYSKTISNMNSFSANSCIISCNPDSFFAYDNISGFGVAAIQWSPHFGSQSIIPFTSFSAYDYLYNFDQFQTQLGPNVGTLTLVSGELIPEPASLALLSLGLLSTLYARRRANRPAQVSEGR